MRKNSAKLYKVRPLTRLILTLLIDKNKYSKCIVTCYLPCAQYVTKLWEPISPSRREPHTEQAIYETKRSIKFPKFPSP